MVIILKSLADAERKNTISSIRRHTLGHNEHRKIKYASELERNFQSCVQSLWVNTSMEMQNSTGGNYQAIIKLLLCFRRTFWPSRRLECNLSQHMAKRHNPCWRNIFHPVRVSYWVNNNKIERKTIIGVHRCKKTEDSEHQ